MSHLDLVLTEAGKHGPKRRQTAEMTLDVHNGSLELMLQITTE